MRKLIILLAFFSLSFFFEKSFALEKKDSLKNVFYSLDTVQNVETLLNARLEIIQLLRYSDYDLYLEFAQKNIELASQHKINWALVDIYMEMGSAFIEKGNYHIALDYLNKAYEFAQLDEYKPYVGWVTLEIGNCYEAMLHHQRAIKFYEISLSVFEETNEPEGVALASTNIGINYMVLNQFGPAEQYLQRGLDERKKLDDPIELGYVQMYFSNLLMSMQKFEEAAQNLISVVNDIDEYIGRQQFGREVVEGKTLTGKILALLSQCYGNLGSAEFKYLKLFEAGEIYKNLNDQLNLADVLNAIAENYLTEGQFNKAIFYADSALQITEGTMILNQQARANKILADSYSGLNDKNHALEYYKQYILLHDSMFNQSVIDAISDVDVLVKTVETEKNNEILQVNVAAEKRLRKIVTTGSSVFLIVLLIGLLDILIKLRKVRRLNNELTLKNKKIEEQTKRLEELNNDLNQLVKSKDKFHSVIAHDLKNPVGSNFNISELLATSYEHLTDAERKKLAGLLYETSKQTLKLLENLLTWSRIQGGHMKVKKTVFDIDKEVEKTIESLRYTASLKSIDVHIHRNGGTEVCADKEMILTVVRNLFSNAVKFTPEGRIISVGVKTKKTMVEVWVEDEGLGIPAAKLEKLLDIDSNYQRAGTNNENGTGLGLQLSNEFVKLNNGYFVIESEENKGSRFAFFLPLYESN
jgi:signal transduction histidine kinase